MHTSPVPLLRQQLCRSLRRLLHHREALNARLQACGITLDKLQVDHKTPWQGRSATPMLLLIAEGQGTLHTPHRQLPSSAGDVVLLAAHQPLRASPPPLMHLMPLQAALLSFDDTFLNQLALPSFTRQSAIPHTDLPRDMTPLPTDRSLLEALDHLLLGLLSAHPGRRPLLVHRTQEVLLALISGPAPQSIHLLTSQQQPSLAEAVRHYVRGQPEHHWTAAELARLLGIGESTLRRKLSAENHPLRMLLQEERMRYAVQLLTQSNQSITEIALACGYDSISRFTARFRSHFHCSPSSYRKQRRACEILTS